MSTSRAPLCQRSATSPPSTTLDGIVHINTKGPSEITSSHPPEPHKITAAKPSPAKAWRNQRTAANLHQFAPSHWHERTTAVSYQYAADAADAADQNERAPAPARSDQLRIVRSIADALA